MSSEQPHSTSTLRVRYAETDQMGVAYHSHYLVWCEVGRTDLIRSLGPSYAAIENDGIRLAVAEAALRYRQPARYDDLIRVETRLERVQSRGVTFAYAIFREHADGERDLLATATTALIAIDHDGRTRRLPDAVRELFGSLAA